MKIPVYHYIEFDQYTKKKDIETVLSSKLEEAPVVINLEHFKKYEYEDFISDLEYELKIRKISPTFPYPIYIITKLPPASS